MADPKDEAEARVDFVTRHREAHSEDVERASFEYVDRRMQEMREELHALRSRVSRLEDDLRYKADERHQHHELADAHHYH